MPTVSNISMDLSTKLTFLERGKENLKSYFVNTTVHGFQYIVDGRNTFEKLFWVVIIAFGFVASAIIMGQSFHSWEDTPVQTTVETVSVPIQNYPFPTITACDTNSIEMPRRNLWMYLEQILNWVDFSRIKEGTVNGSRLPNTSDFELSKITLQINKLLGKYFLFPEYRKQQKVENIRKRHRKNPEGKDCWDLAMYNNDYVHTCGEILEFLILGMYRNHTKVTDNLYEAALQYWGQDNIGDSYFLDQVDSDYIIKHVMYPAYEEFYLDNHKKIKATLNTDQLDELNNFSFYNMKSCNSNKYCIAGLKELVTIWKQVYNVVMIAHSLEVPQITDLGSIIANFNFLLLDRELWYNFENEYQNMTQQISTMISFLHPGLLPNSRIFIQDILKLLGFTTAFSSEKPIVRYLYLRDFLSPGFSAPEVEEVFQDNSFMDNSLDNFYDNAGLGGNSGNPKFKNGFHCDFKSLDVEWQNYLRSKARNSKEEGKVPRTYASYTYICNIISIFFLILVRPTII